MRYYWSGPGDQIGLHVAHQPQRGGVFPSTTMQINKLIITVGNLFQARCCMKIVAASLSVPMHAVLMTRVVKLTH